MPQLKRNDRQIRSAIINTPGVFQIEGVPGLNLHVRRPYRASWFVRYTPRRLARQERFWIGDALSIDLETAAAKTREVLRQVQVEGRDPEAERRSERQRTVFTFEDLFHRWLVHPGRRRALTPRTRHEYEALYRRHIQSTLGATPLADFTESKVAELIERVRVATTDEEKGYRGLQATKVYKLLHSIGEFAVDDKLITINPVRTLREPVPVKNPDGRQYRPPTDEELRTIWHEAPKYMSEQNAIILRLAILLGKRVSEIVETKKSELKLERHGTWFIPADRTGNKGRIDQVVPLPKT
ncbi:MAG: integrase family protein, partial [Proteobacteria bacterium]|nr:integrase family protein [Pseudomonadota bacterium]